jgi:hypothetical protein
MTIQENLSSGHSLSISKSCQALEVSRSGYCKWRTLPNIASTDSEDMNLKIQFQGIAPEFPSCGYRIIAAELQDRCYAVNRKRVLRMIAEAV